MIKINTIHVNTKNKSQYLTLNGPVTEEKKEFIGGGAVTGTFS
jgi:hypothetical protein